MDPEDFVGQNVLILGRGNSAFETAENILGVTNFIHMLSRSRVRLSWATHYVGDIRYVPSLLVCSMLPILHQSVSPILQEDVGGGAHDFSSPAVGCSL